MMAASGSYFQQMRYCTWSLLILSLIQLTCGASDEKMSVTVAGGGTATETSFLHSGPAADTPEQAYLHLLMKQQYEKDKMDLMKTGLTDEMKKNKNKIEATLIGEPATRKGRGKKGDKKMQMLYLGLMYIKSVIQMVMMAMGQVLQFKSVMISLVSVLIQVAQFVMMLRQKHGASKTPHSYHSGKLAPVESPGWSGTSSYDHAGSSEIVEDGGLGTYAGYRYDTNQPPNPPDPIGHSYTYGPSFKH